MKTDLTTASDQSDADKRRILATASRNYSPKEHAGASGNHPAKGMRRNFQPVKTVLLLIISNLFMNLAWYGHLKFKSSPLWIAILGSWAIALFEYTFQVPANRLGAKQWDVAQLKILQEAITLGVFCIVAYLCLGRHFGNGTISAPTSAWWARSFSPLNSSVALFFGARWLRRKMLLRDAR